MNKEIKLLDGDAVKSNFGTGISHPCATSPLKPVLS